MTRVRGRKGFDALFSRVFDEPGLKDAVDSLHNGFDHKEPPPSPTPEPDNITDPAPVSDPHPTSIKIPSVVAAKTSSSDKPKSPQKLKKSAHDEGTLNGPVTGTPTSTVKGTDTGTPSDTVKGTDTSTLTSIPSGTVSGIATDTPTGIANGTVSRIPNDTLSSTLTGTHNDGSVSGTPTGIVSDIDAGMDASKGAGMCANPDESGTVNGTPRGMDVHMDAGIDAGTPNDIPTGILTPTPRGTPTGTDPGTLLGTPNGALTGKFIYDDIPKRAWLPFSPGQGKVLLFLIEAGGKTNRNVIEAQTGVPLNSLAKTLSMLEKKGYFRRSEQKIYEHRDRGFFYTIDRQMCGDFYERIRGTHISTHSGILTGTHTGMPRHTLPHTLNSTVPGTPTGIHAGTQVPLSSSSKIFEKLTTTETCSGEGKILTGAIGVYWGEEGLSETQAAKWCVQFEVDPAVMRLQLDWARFDLEVNGRRAEVKKDVVSWFFGVLRTTGGAFPRPANYKSPAELRAEALELEIAKDKEAKTRLAAAEAEQEFQRILANPEGPEYQGLFNELNSFAREMDGQQLEIVLRESFVKKRSGETN